jgi:hypothetical protein
MPAVLDLVTDILLEKGLMERLASDERNSCQGGGNDEIASSDCDDGKYKV